MLSGGTTKRADDSDAGIYLFMTLIPKDMRLKIVNGRTRIVPKKKGARAAMG